MIGRAVALILALSMLAVPVEGERNSQERSPASG
jgi:hypothetical protein